MLLRVAFQVMLSTGYMEKPGMPPDGIENYKTQNGLVQL